MRLPGRLGCDSLLLDDGRVRYRLKRPWPRPGGITELVLDPVDFLALHNGSASGPPDGPDR